MDSMTISILAEIIKAKGSDFDRYLAEAHKVAIGVSQSLMTGYPITIDYSQPLDQMIRAGQYDTPTPASMNGTSRPKESRVWPDSKSS